MDWSYSKEFRVPLYKYSISSVTTQEQIKTENLVNDVYYTKKDILKENYLKLFKLIHIVFLKSNLYHLPNSYESLDASQTWLIYWNVHSLKILNFRIPDDLRENIIKDIQCCQNPSGGFGGGPHQVSHMATTYASVMALVEMMCPEAYDIICRPRLREWLLEMHLENGAFIMHHGGEVDVRGCYCAVSVAKAAGIYSEELFTNTAQWIASCQTYEGGFGGAPGLEAHGGYTFCALAALLLLDGVHLIDLDGLLRWAANRQMSSEGGFQGRTNKLVDSCYTYWVGALFTLLHQALVTVGRDSFENQQPLFDVSALQEYVVVCCQRISPPYHNPNGGGMIDKPGKSADPYHTCYALSGLSLAQGYESAWNPYLSKEKSINDLEVLDPIFNVTKNAMEFCDSFNAK